MSTAATLVLKVVADTSSATRGMDSVSKSTSSFKSKVAGASKVAGVALLGIGAAAIVAGKAAAEDAQSQALLANAMTKNAGASKASIAATEDWIAKQSLATGVADDELRPALGNLVRATGDVAKSQDALQVAMDVSAATGKDLGSVTKAMGKGFAGSTTALGKLVPGISKAALESGDMNKIMGELADKTGGAMAAKAGTAAGQMDRMTVAMDEAQESIGAALLPAMSAFAGIAATVAKVIMDNAKAFQIIIGIVAAFAAAIVVLNYAIKAYGVITKAVGIIQKATWLASPIGLVVLAVIAVIAAMVLLYKKSSAFRNFVNKMWAGIKSGARAAAQVFKAVWQAAVAVVRGYVQAWVAYFRLVFSVVRGLVKLVVAVFKGDWRGALDAVKGIIGNFRDFFRNIFNALPDPVQRLVEKIRNALGGAFDWLKDKARTLGDALSHPFETATDAVGWLIDKVESLIGWLGKIKIPDLGKLGGLIGKVTGISAMTATSAAAPSMMSARGVSAFGAPMLSGGSHSLRKATPGGVTIQVNGALDPEAVARQINRILNGHNRRVGLVSA